MNDIDQIPSAPDSERAIISVLLLDGSVADARDKIKPSHFFTPSHRTMYEALLRLHGRGIKPDPIQLTEELRTMHKLDDVGGGAYIADVQGAGISCELGGHIDRVVETFKKRKLHAKLTRAAEAANNGRTAAQIADMVRQVVEEVSEQKPEVGKEPVEPVVVVAHSHVLDSILDKVVKVNFGKLFENIEAVKQKHYLVASIEQLLATVKAQQYQLARKNDFVFAFNGQYWSEIDKEALKDFLMAAAQKQGVQPFEAKHYEFRDKLHKQFLALAGLKAPEPAGGKVLINMLNGTFEITAESQELRDFKSSDFLRHQLQFEYNKDATASKFQAYLDKVLPDKQLQDIVAEFFGYVFTRKLKLEKALLLYGSGANGKSVLFDVMNALLGRENTGNYSLADLMEEHNRAQIAHKLLNYGSEINASVTKDIFKILVSGEVIMARLKYGNSFLMEDYAKLCFNCNELPKDIEQNEAYFRRLLIIPFRVTIPEAEQDKELAQKIISDELSGVFNWVLGGLNRILKQRKFTDSKAVRDMLDEYKRDSDSVACWLRDENWAKDPHNPEHTTTLKVLHMSYTSYCKEAGHKPLGRNNFKKRLTHNRIVEATKAGCSQEFYINHIGWQG